MEIEEIDDLSTDLLHRQHSRRYANQQATITEEEIPPELFITDEESSETDEESNESEINNGNNNDYEYTEIFENYAPPVYEQFQDRISPDTNANRQFLWILLWIMSFRKRFNIPETATEVLIQFIKLLLIEIGGSNFEEFPEQLQETILLSCVCIIEVDFSDSSSIALEIALLLREERAVIDSSSLLSKAETDEESNESEINNGNNNDYEYTEIFENYAPPVYEQFQDRISPDTNANRQFLWILLWIMSFRKRFNIPETATEVLIQFIKLLLIEIGGSNFEEFPGSLYLARNVLGLKDQHHNFAACLKCHKLYNKKEVEEFQQNGNLTVMKCSHVEFPNSTSRRLKQCQTPLAERSTLLHGRIKIRSEKIFPFASIRNQLASMYCRLGFERNLRHWSERKRFDNILTDIYDSQVWKNFKETSDENSAKFFRPEVADSNLGLMLNLDWFQPYNGVIHSTGVIYAAICNLPQDMRFKRENMLVLGLLPGPNEVSLHQINHYLAPIVNKLVLLWDGVTFDNTFEYQEPRKI
ncbi:hypothetical protein RirG_157130 [Rhizophagus irregularis DAOM 197198w]|uniref:Transposase domain-containing protein n=1 Tax=Rhizophagus irregularis (strain DAOM 197198w) TaxID=1432141 RepID=A0A015KSR1_RHIIW|nr:hypothetical protein RirG_157130 [Rhizophagus irregularis DAOM 197198w]